MLISGPKYSDYHKSHITAKWTEMEGGCTAQLSAVFTDILDFKREFYHFSHIHI